MSRSGYTDDYDDIGSLNLYRATVARTIAGKRGQAFLREMADALDAMPVKELIPYELVAKYGVCAIGSVAVARGLDVSNIDELGPDFADDVAAAFGIARSLAAEIAYENDERSPWATKDPETPAQRWTRMRAWVDENLADGIEPEKK